MESIILLASVYRQAAEWSVMERSCLKRLESLMRGSGLRDSGMRGKLERSKAEKLSVLILLNLWVRKSMLGWSCERLDALTGSGLADRGRTAAILHNALIGQLPVVVGCVSCSYKVHYVI